LSWKKPVSAYSVTAESVVILNGGVWLPCLIGQFPAVNMAASAAISVALISSMRWTVGKRL